ncbi:hypothetical protein [Pyrobaculum islandicum]|nr:hypothetical protein [Pyrobaculum islandicum]
MYAFVDMPFSPSGVTHLVRLHRSVGFEKELQEVADVLKVVKEGNINVLAVIIAPYGWGKSELLDEVEKLAAEEGFAIVRFALSLDSEFLTQTIAKEKNKPMLVLIDEADEISRIAAVHKLGALSDEKFVKMIQKVATYIRALLEPRSYRHMLGDPERFNKIAIIIALTPQLYYTILKNVIPDVFDITSGRVYKEIVLDTRYPFWQFVETVKQRLSAYSSQERLRKIEKGDIDPLSPFTLHELAALYHLAKRKGEVTPRSLMKLTARLFQLKKEGGRLAYLLREEGINPDLDDEVLELAFAGISFEKKTPISKEVYVYRVPYEDKEALVTVREYLLTRGKDIDLKDPKNVSYEPYFYYSLIEHGKLYIYVFTEDSLDISKYLIGKKYLVLDDIAKLVGIDEVQSVATLTRELSQKLENYMSLLEEVEHIIGIDGIRLRICCGYAIWQNNMGIRESYIFIHVDREDELKKVIGDLTNIIAQGAVGGYVIDYMNIFITSRVLLSETIQAAVMPLMSAYWKRYYPEPAANYVTIQIYGADRIEKLKHEVIKFEINKLLRRSSKFPEFVDVIRLGREKARENIIRYTLALRKSKEKKQSALIKVAEALDEGQEVEGFKSYRLIEEILLNTFEESIHEKELRSIIVALFPTNLWREIREDDVIELMKLRGVLIPNGDYLYKFNEELARRYLGNILDQIKSFSEVVIEKQTPLGTIRLSKKIDVTEVRASFEDRKTYAKALREALQKLIEAKERYEEIRRELEREAEERAKLLRRISTILERYPQRSKFIDVVKIRPQDVEREETLVQKVEEVLKIWGEIKHMAKYIRSKIDVERDLEILLELPEPWLDDYISTLRLYAFEISKRYEKIIQLERERKTALEWLKAKFGDVGDDLEKAIVTIASKLGINARLLEAVARRGKGAVLDVEELAKEVGLEKPSVEEYLERLHKVGAVEKKYVA